MASTKKLKKPRHEDKKDTILRIVLNPHHLILTPLSVGIESEMNKATSFPRSGVGMPKHRSSGTGRRSVPHCVPTPERGNDSNSSRLPATKLSRCPGKMRGPCLNNTIRVITRMKTRCCKKFWSQLVITPFIELLAKNLHNHNRLKIRYSLNDLFNDLQHKGLLKLNGQSVSSVYHSNGAALRKETPEAIIAAMYDLGELSDAEQALMSVFAVLSAENIASEFRVSPVVQEITRQKNQARLRQDCLNLIDSLSEQLKYEVGTGHFINADYQQAALFARHAESVVCHIVEPNESLAVLCERLGRYHRTTGNLDRALGFYEDLSRLGKALYEADPNNVSFKNGLAISYSKLGETHAALGDLDRALGFFEEYSRLRKALYEADPDNVSFKNGLAISYLKLGETHAELGHLDRALGFFEERSRLSKELYEAYPDNVSFKNGLAISFIKLGFIFEKFGKKEKSQENFEQAEKLLEQLVTDCPGYVEFQKNLERLVPSSRNTPDNLYEQRFPNISPAKRLC